MNQFFETYKKLDRLIKDCLACESNVSGITAYIELMKAANPALSKRIPEWEYVLLSLKKYRHIRNQMAHESTHDPYCTQDIMWLESFHQRVLHCVDPLAKYYRLQREIRQNATQQKEKSHPIKPVQRPYSRQESRQKTVRPYNQSPKPHQNRKKVLPVWLIVLILFFLWILVCGFLFRFLQITVPAYELNLR